MDSERADQTAGAPMTIALRKKAASLSGTLAIYSPSRMSHPTLFTSLSARVGPRCWGSQSPKGQPREGGPSPSGAGRARRQARGALSGRRDLWRRGRGNNNSW